MKDNSLDGHRGKVAVSETTRNLPQQTGSSSNNSNTTNSSSTSGKCDLKAPPPASAVTVGASGGGTSNSNDGPSATNFDDDYNEWELGIGDLIIDLDADIEKTNERNSANPQQSSHHHHHHTQNHSHHQNGSISVPPSPSSSSVANSIIASPTASSATAFSFLGTQSPCGNPGVAMSNSKSSRNIGSAGSSSSNVTVTSSSSSASSGSSGSVVGGISSGGGTGSSTGNTGSSSNSSGVGQSVTGAVEHQATVDKGLKMKIKRKTVGNKYSEAKHEIVQSDTKSPVSASEGSSSSAGSVGNVNCVGGQASSAGPACNDTPKSKHSSSKGRNNSHREKKEKNREKDKSSSGTARASATVEVNGVLGVMSPSLKITNSGLNLSNPGTPTGSSAASPLSSQSGGGSNSSSSAGSSSAASAVQASRCGLGAGTGNSAGASNAGVQPTPTASPATASGTSVSDSLQQGFASTAAGVSSASNVGSCSGGCVTTVSQAISLSSNSPPMPNLTLKLENKFSPTTACSVVVKQEDRALSPPMKRLKMEPTESDAEASGSPVPPEMKDTSTCTSVGTITEPDCLGPCEPGTSVMLEGIVWQETEGGVLVVNVTWRGKTYVGTLLDCTKHDWAPPRFCESPTSDVDAKTTKGRGKRGRGANSSSEVSAFDTRNCVQSKLRNGKGRRTTINSSFTVPSSPAKSEGSSSNSKRKGRPADLEISHPSAESKTPKRSRVHSSRGTPTPSGGSSSNSSEFPQPSSPLLIECPEPNCSKKYKHINGLRYHQQHAHSGSSDGNKLDDTTTEDSKDVTNSSDNEESTQENISVPASPAMSFANSVSPHPGTGRPPPAESSSSASSSSAPSLPESETYTLTQDLSTLASVAVGDPKPVQKTCSNSSSSSASRATPTITPSPSQQSTASQELPVIVAADGTKSSSSTPAVLQNTSSCSSVPISVVSSVASAPDIVHSPTVPAAANTVIQASVSDAAVAPTAAVTVSIPTSHVVFNQGITAAGVSCVTTTTPTTTVAISCHGSTTLPSPRPSGHPTVGASAYVPVVSSVSSVPASSPSAIAAADKSKPKQQIDTRPDKYKPKSPLAPPGIRPIVPAPAPQLIALQSNIPSSLPPGVSAGGHSLVTSSLKPIQPKPTILGEPTNVNPALESLKKDKSKHKKKSKDKERKPGSLPLSVKMPGDECEPVEVSPYPSLEAVAGNRDPLGSGAGALPSVTHQAISSLDGQKSSGSLDLSLAEDNMNENVQSPAYSDISDANDTAPVLESEVPPVKEKEDKVGKTTPDAAQSPATNISAYGMYPYYSQPPYLLPSVSPQNSTPGGGQASVIEKQEQKKTEQERVKESRPWSNPAGELRERPSGEPEGTEKKVSRENGTPNSGVISSPAAAAGNPPLQEYQMQQPYPYSYGYVQGYPYAVEQNYHMHLLESEQYKQYIEGQQRLYKEQQQQQQQQQQAQQQQQHHHQQQQQQHSHQQQQHSSHHHQQPQQQHHHHSQHQSHHHSKIHHSSMLKDDRDRSRDHKDRLGGSASSHGDHMGKMQHSSVSLVVNKEHDIREQQQQQQPPPDGRPPSLPTQVRSESSTPSASASLKEKQNENHQILKENIELKSQMDDKNKINQFEMAMLYERHREDMRRYYMLQERIIEQQQQKMEPGYHHHTHHHQTIQAHQMPSHSLASLKSHKDDMPGSGAAGHSKPNHYESSRSSAVMSPAKSDHMKISSSSHPHSSSSSPKGSIRDSSVGAPKDYASSSSRDGSTSKKDGMSSKSSDRSDSSGREEKVKSEKLKSDSKPESEGQKPTMETTGPPPPPTNAYAYLHPSYLQPPPPHFPHMPFEPAHAVYRSGLNPMIMSTPPYGSSPYMHPQLRYVPPGTCEIPAHSQASDPLGKGLHPPGPPKALDLLHQVSQHYTTTHKIHELQEHALMSPTPTSTPTSSTTPSSSSSSSSAVNCKVSTAESTTTVSKVDAASNRDSSRSPPTQRHLHTHHHTHVGVGYPIYDPYGAPVPQRPCT